MSTIIRVGLALAMAASLTLLGVGTAQAQPCAIKVGIIIGM